VVGVHAVTGVPTVSGLPDVVVVPTVDIVIDTGQRFLTVSMTPVKKKFPLNVLTGVKDTSKKPFCRCR